MAILSHINKDNTYIKYDVIDHRIDELEGSQLCFEYVLEGKRIYEQNFGWTNRTVHSFIHMLKQFPLPIYEGYFSHFEKHLEVKWEYNEVEDDYTVHFIDANTSMIIKTTREQLIVFGNQFEKEWHQSPVIN